MKQRIKKNMQLARLVIYQETLIDYKENFFTFLGAFTGICLIGFIQSLFFDNNDNLFLIGSFGASSVLVYGVIQSPMAQPRNLIGGHLVSAIVGVSISKAIPDPLWLAASLAVALSIVLMQITKTLHPPGGATALIAVIGSEHIKSLGYLYVFSPVLTGSLILLFVALIFNNITPARSYPNNKGWYKIWKRNYRQ